MILKNLCKIALIGAALIGTVIAKVTTLPVVSLPSAHSAGPVVPVEMVEHINTVSTWKADHSEWTRMSIDEAKCLMGTNFINNPFDLSDNNGIECSLCQYAVSWVEGKLISNSTEADIEKVLDEVCNILPSEYQQGCQTIINTYTPELVSLLMTKASPDVICQAIKLCTTNMLETNGIECELCQYAMAWVEKEVESNFTETKIIELLDKVCGIMPKTYQALCDEMIDNYTPHLIELLLNKFTPEVICQTIKVCTSELSAIPTNFDGRQAFGQCIHPVRDQQQCGSCWAFSASEVLSDRFCIASKGQVNVVLAPQTLVSCDQTNMGCQGGYLDKAWAFMVQNGLATDQCEPYTSGDGSVAQCPTKCSDGSAIKYYKAKNYKHILGITNIQNDLMTNGPSQAAFEVYQDFMAYKSGVYQHTTGSLLGGHAVELVGWGIENNLPYWLLKNSWTTNWGDQGYFKIIRGKNECGIESSIYSGQAAV